MKRFYRVSVEDITEKFDLEGFFLLIIETNFFLFMLVNSFDQIKKALLRARAYYVL